MDQQTAYQISIALKATSGHPIGGMQAELSIRKYCENNNIPIRQSLGLVVEMSDEQKSLFMQAAHAGCKFSEFLTLNPVSIKELELMRDVKQRGGRA